MMVYTPTDRLLDQQTQPTPPTAAIKRLLKKSLLLLFGGSRGLQAPEEANKFNGL